VLTIGQRNLFFPVEWPRCPGDAGGCDDVSPISVHVHVIYVVMCYDVMGQSSLFHVPPSFLAASSSPCADSLCDA
jgi:hypothetical protein